MSKRQKTTGRTRGEWQCVPLADDASTWIFLKRGATDREVLVGNLDLNHTEGDLSAAFAEFGSVERVELEPVAGQSGGALVVFGAAASAAAALAAETVRLAASGSCPVRGLQRWAAACQGRMRQPEHLQRQVSAFMAEFDARQAVAEREAREEVVDADGFTLVSRARGRRGASDGEVHVRAAQGRAKRARGTAQEAFYGLQKLRARRQAVQQLRANRERRGSSRSPPRKARGGGGASREAGGGMLLSFAHFQNGGARTADEYDGYVRGFQERAARAFFERHKDEMWLLERYHPAEVERRALEAARAAQGRALLFAASLPPPGALALAPLFDRAPAEAPAAGEASNAVVVSGVASRTATASLLAAAQVEGAAVTECAVSMPSPKARFTRSAFVAYDSPAAAARAARQLDGLALDGELLQCVVARPASQVPPAATPPIAATPLRIARDLQNATMLADALDAEAGIPMRGFVLDPEAGEAARLDVLIAYLREVHLFCYYNWTQYESVAELAATCPVYYRDRPPAPVQPGEGSVPLPSLVTQADPRGDAWAQTLDFNANVRAMRAFNAGARLGRAEAERAVAALQARNCQPDGEGRFRCVECKKVFLTPEFVGKHLHNKHQELVDYCRTVALAEQCFRNYFTDPERIAREDQLDNEDGGGGGRDAASAAAGSGACGGGGERERRGPRLYPPPAVPLPGSDVPDPRGIRSYSDVAAPAAVAEEEIDYRTF